MLRALFDSTDLRHPRGEVARRRRGLGCAGSAVRRELGRVVVVVVEVVVAVEVVTMMRVAMGGARKLRAAGTDRPRLVEEGASVQACKCVQGGVQSAMDRRRLIRGRATQGKQGAGVSLGFNMGSWYC
jgi:hypothetical protein